ncbi:hypothetical protein [Verminephrobacter aporrectodeae]|nr:hypothetical protein [Verminephrobacter aporrectodeae]
MASMRLSLCANVPQQRGFLGAYPLTPLGYNCTVAAQGHAFFENV